MSDLTDEQLFHRFDEIREELEHMLAEHMEANHPGVEYHLDVFDSENGEPDWVMPMAASLQVPGLGVEDAYGLCDGGYSTAWDQADFLLKQLLEEAKPQIERFNE